MTVSRKLSSSLSLIAIAILCSLLYLPFLHSEVIFDDQGFFTNGKIYDYAQIPFNLVPRSFPYFTLGFVSVLSRGIEANRLVSISLHIFCAWMIYLLLKNLLIQARITTARPNEFDTTRASRDASVLATIGASWFAIHPVAVYGAGYLSQRTILFATLFSLLSLWFYRRAIAENRTADIVTAALFYSIAVFSKEHAIMLPIAALSLAAMYEASFRSQFKRVALYLVLCTPAAVIVFLNAKHVVSTSYEPDVLAMIQRMHDISIMAKPWGQWAVSIVMQAGFFFDYPAFWLIPDVRLLSADMRVDFVHIWFSWWIWPKAFLFFLSPILALYFLRRKGWVALFFCGFLYCWFLFLTELVAVRFQEPFVLYRSYLWAPGYLMMIAAICARVRLRWFTLIAMPVLVVCFFLARERLTSLATEANVWKDAANKLESPSLIGSDRIFYNRGRAYLQEKKYTEAIEDFSRTIRMNPKVSQAYYNRALAFYALKYDAEAIQDLDSTALLNQKDSSIQYVRGLVFERNGCTKAASAAYASSLLLGNRGAQVKLDSLLQKLPEKRISQSDSLKCPL
jgi:hypothetical protein